MILSDLYMIAGFSLAAYAIVSNDAIQTLGTFIAANGRRPWWMLWAFACSILAVVLVYGWWVNGGDPAYGRLSKFPMPPDGIGAMYLVPPLVILILTRMGIPVSTTFLILTVFAIGGKTPGNISAMLLKSGMGYGLAFVVSILLYATVLRRLTTHLDTTDAALASPFWTWTQWASTGFLWSQWLIQDLANIYAYLPRRLSVYELLVTLVWLFMLHAWIFYRAGGAIQKIVTSKSGTMDIRGATIINVIYGAILLFFKEWSQMPMSTTWAFLGLLAGREFAISFHLYRPSPRDTFRVVSQDAVKALIGLLVSLLLAFGLPLIFALLT